MATIAEALALAIQQHQAGQLHAAEQIYRQILAADPNHVDSLHLLGVIALQSGHFDTAVNYIRRAIELNPNEPAFHTDLVSALKNLGNTHQAQGKPDEAVACFQQALTLIPDSAEVLSDLGNAYQAQGNLNEAIESYRRALLAKPDFAVAHYNLANALKRVGKFEEAIASYRIAIQRKPDFAEALHNLGRVFASQGNLDEAAACFRQAIASNPRFSEAYNNLGNILCALTRHEEALSYYRRAIELRPDGPDAYSNLGNAFRSLGKLDQAAAFCRHALALDPSNPEALTNLGNALQAQGELPAALDSYRRTLELRPNDADAHSNLGSALHQLGQFASARASYAQALQLNPNCAFAHYGQATLNLLHGHFENGWPEFEWRFRTNPLGVRDFGGSVTVWNGSLLGNRTILLHAEEIQGGLGDTIQFVRYAALIKKQNPAATVIVECQRPLARVLACCPDIDRLIPRGDELPPLDVHAPLMSLPGILKTSLETIPANVPYLFADPALIDQWRKTLEPVRGLRIGVNWRARPITRYRNIPLECIARLAELSGVKLIGLQQGATQELSAAIGNNLALIDLGDDFDTTHGAFMDTAAVMMNLDLVISSDTAIPHLAGALGVPVWLAHSFVPDWRWLLDQSDSPWYPTMRLFRQKTPGDWNGVFDEILAELQNLAPAAR